MNSNINKTSQNLREEVKQDLNKLGKDLNSLRDKLTPGQFIDDALSFRSQRSPRATFDYLKDNPLGFSLLTIGTVLLMENDNHESYESIVKTNSDRIYKDVKGRVSDKVTNAKSVVADKVTSIKDNVSEKIGDAKELVDSDFALDLMGGSFSYMAIGAGLGALTGASFPSTSSSVSTSFTKELEAALNESAMILKNELLAELTQVDMKVFGRSREKEI